MAINEEARIPVYLNDEQAKSAFKNLQSEADKWRKKMHEAMAGGDMKGMKEAEREMKKTTAQANKLKKEAFDVNKVLNNLSSASINDLRKTMSSLRKEQAGLNRDSKEYIAIQGKIDSVKNEFSKINGKITEQQGALGKLKNLAKTLLPAFGFAAIIAGAKKMFDSIVSSTDTLGTKWDMFMGGMNEATSEFFRTLATGDWSNFMDNMRSAINVGREYERMLDDIEARQRGMDKAEADARMEKRVLEDTVRNTSLSNEVRTAAAEKRIKLEERLEKQRIALAKEQYKADLLKAQQSTKLTEERINELIDAKSVETDLQAKSLIELREHYAELEKVNRGSVYGTQNSYTAETPEMKQLKAEINGFPAFISSYADDLEKLGNATDDRLNKLVASYGKVKEAEVSSLENTKRVRSAMYSIMDEEARAKMAANNQKEKDAKGPDFAGMLAPEEESAISSFAEKQMRKDIEIFAEKKRTEEEWTAFLKQQIDERMDAEAEALEFEREIDAARQDLKAEYIDAIGTVAKALSGMFEENSAAQIAMLAIEKAAAIAQIIFQTGIANAKAAAASPLTLGQPWVTINTVAAAASIAGIVATTVGQVSKSNKNAKSMAAGGFAGYTGAGGKYEESELVQLHKSEYVLPKEGTQNPQLKPILDIFEIARRNGSLARLDLRQIVQAIPARQFAQGGYASTPVASSPPTGGDAAGRGGTDPDLKNLIRENIKTMKELQKLKVSLSLETFERERGKYLDIKQTRGL